MARVQGFENPDEIFANTERPIVVNHMPVNTQAQREEIHDLVITTYNKADSLSAVPACNCKKLKNGYNEGVTCDSCGSVVTTATKRELKPDVFIAAPETIPKLFNPMFWTMLYKSLDMTRGKGTNGLRWLCDRRATFGKETKRIKEFIRDFEKTGLSRGLTNVVENFDAYLPFILSKVTNHKLRQHIHDVYVENREVVFCKYLAIPSKVAFVVEVTHVGTYYNKIMDSVVEAVYTAVSIDKIKDHVKVESRMTTVQELLGRYYTDLMATIVSSKLGLLRRDCYGSKTNFSIRTIVSSLHEAHNYYNVEVPYSLALVSLHTLVINVLVNKHNMTYKQAYDYTEEHARYPEPLIMSILEDFGRDGGEGKGVPYAFTRLTRNNETCFA